jgi:hypothetical protein
VRRPVAGEWDRFESYAHRIKDLSCSSDWIEDRDSEIIEDEMFEALADHFQKSPVLPNLRHLSCHEGAGINKYMGLFLTPRLTHLLFSPSTRSSPDPAVVESINTACPNLRNLEIRPSHFFSHRPRGLLTSTSTLIGKLSVLESLHCQYPISPAAILHISRLPSLKKVNLFDHPHAIASSLAGTSVPAFAHLTTLVIKAWDCPSTANLLMIRALYLKKLKTLEIIFASSSDFRSFEALLKLYHPHTFNNYRLGWPDNDGLSQVFTAIQASCDGLQSLLITSQRKDISFPLSPNIIAPLFSLRNLTSLRIDSIPQCDLDDVVLMEMAIAWPLLRELRFCVTRRNFQPKATLEGLATIISGCSQLREVYAAIYVSAVQTRDIDVQEYNSNGSVFKLCLKTSLVDDDVNLVELAEIFAILCPKLGYLTIKPASLGRILRNLLTAKTCQ